METKYNEIYYESINDVLSEGYKKLISKLVLDLPLNGKILDVGCGKANYLKNIHELRPDLQLYGIDIGDMNSSIPSFINFQKASGDNIPFENNMFDLLVCFHVIEHLLNPYDFMIEFHRVVKSNGLLYIEMPYYKTAFIPEGNANFWSEPTHIRPYNYYSVERLLKENGFLKLEINVWRNWISVLLFPYLLFKRIFFKDYDALSTFYANLYGISIGGLGQNIKKE
ncbi:MAG: class I SAM-dependent methyltransferase [Methanobacteriaceae archaeon]|jgi:ubiquinone/menaquinone biosynthesis C-methylase UbiE|nr:class I SAM-dependent methyltransferase [Methanobacteriaceae archaeon]MDO9626340.1 class I SAM-dependent methyltransferase [Methanobacteriaceae archaeon]